MDGFQHVGPTISGSSTDPFVGTGSLEAIDFVYLWLACSEGLEPAGASAVAFDLIPSGLDILAYQNVSDFINIGMILVLTAPISVEDSSWGSVKALYR